MMMYNHRGVLPHSAIAPVYTFGAPAIFCEGACCTPCQDGSGLCSADPLPPAQLQAQAPALNTSATEPVTDNNGHVKSQGILQALGLENGAVRNVFMSRDIVPRAFACDYTLVADLLRRVGEGFREHDCLMGEGRSVACMCLIAALHADRHPQQQCSLASTLPFYRLSDCLCQGFQVCLGMLSALMLSSFGGVPG